MKVMFIYPRWPDKTFEMDQVPRIGDFINDNHEIYKVLHCTWVIQNDYKGEGDKVSYLKCSLIDYK